MNVRLFFAAIPFGLFIVPAAAHLGAGGAAPTAAVRSAARSESGWIGITLSAAGDRVTIERVFGGTPAQEAGLRAGDRVLALDGREVSNVGELVERVSGRSAGESVQLSVERDGWRRTFEITLAPRPDQGAPDAGGDGVEELAEAPILRDVEISTLSSQTAAPRAPRHESRLRKLEGELKGPHVEIIAGATGAYEKGEAETSCEGASACCGRADACQDGPTGEGAEECEEPEECEPFAECEALSPGVFSFALTAGGEDGVQHFRWVPVEEEAPGGSDRIIHILGGDDEEDGARFKGIAVVEIRADEESPEGVRDLLIRRLGDGDHDEHEQADHEGRGRHRHRRDADGRDVEVKVCEVVPGLGPEHPLEPDEGGAGFDDDAHGEGYGERHKRIRVRLEAPELEGAHRGERVEKREIEVEVRARGGDSHHRRSAPARVFFRSDDAKEGCADCEHELEVERGPHDRHRVGRRDAQGAPPPHRAKRLAILMRLDRDEDCGVGCEKDGETDCEQDCDKDCDKDCERGECRVECEVSGAAPHGLGAFGLSRLPGVLQGRVAGPRAFAWRSPGGLDRTGPPADALRELREQIGALREEVRELRRAMREHRPPGR